MHTIQQTTLSSAPDFTLRWAAAVPGPISWSTVVDLCPRPRLIRAGVTDDVALCFTAFLAIMRHFFTECFPKLRVRRLWPQGDAKNQLI